MFRYLSIAGIALLLLSLTGYRAFATHIIGGEMTYVYIGSNATFHNYRVSLTIYEDCLRGSAAAIAKDNPAYFVVYDQDNQMVRFDSATYISSTNVPPNYDIACITNAPEMCALKKTFVIDFALPRNHKKFTVAYQRCCRNGDIANINDPSGTGSTFLCEIPSDTVVPYNNSAVFTNYPPQIICHNTPLFYNNSATDADGDSLSYMLCESYDSPNGLDDNIIPLPPPYSLVAYKHPPYSYYNPLTGAPPLAIDPATGMITGTPINIGRYLVSVCCSEWRHGVLINTIHREFQFVVTDCSKAVVANMPSLTGDPAVYQITCHDYNIAFINTSVGGSAWLWDFGVQGSITDTSSVFEPVYTYPDSGIYMVKLIANPHTPCADSVMKLVKIFPSFYTAFEDTGKLCPGDTIGFLDRSVSTISNVSAWRWNFGDGQFSTEQNPIHSFAYGGTFNVMLTASNQKQCVDTSVHQVTVEVFKPFAGNDTIIVKGESVQMSASGGVDYTWSPPINLTKPTGNPIGYFADSGMYSYTVSVRSANGCMGSDTINIYVVDQAAFFVPTGFSPNGDGLNDVFRPSAVGFRSVSAFRVFNRYGEQVYLGHNITDGWDGTYNRKQADMGTYFWTITYIDRFGKEGNMKGDVTLVK